MIPATETHNVALDADGSHVRCSCGFIMNVTLYDRNESMGMGRAHITNPAAAKDSLVQFVLGVPA